MKLILILLSIFPFWNAGGDCLVISRAYPGQVQSCAGEMVLKNGERIPLYNPELKRDVDSMMANPDVAAVFYYSYGAEKRNDAGRIRLYPLLSQTYGGNRKDIRSNLVKIPFFGTTVLFNKKNGAAEALKEVRKDLKKALKLNPKLKKYLAGAQTFCFRKIAGTPFLSSHSYGIALDLKPSLGRYWRWEKNWRKVKQIEYPREIVRIFEKYGFIWGGRWEHFDSMHFEYRPEFKIYQNRKGE